MTGGEIIMAVGWTILAIYPIFIAILLDILIFMVLLKESSRSNQPFLTGFLLGSMFNSNRHDRSYDAGSTHLALIILAPINAALAVLLCLYLGMSLPLAMTVCFAPLGGALALIALGAIIHHINFKEGAKNLAQGVQQVSENLFDYLTKQKPTMGIGFLLAVTLVVGVALLFHFGLPLYAYGLGLVAAGALILLGLGYTARFLFEAMSKNIAGRGYPNFGPDDARVGKQPASILNPHRDGHQQLTSDNAPNTPPKPSTPEPVRKGESDDSPDSQPGAQHQ